MASLCNRPIGMLKVPVTAAGVNPFSEASLSLGTTFTQEFPEAIIAFISSSGIFFFSLIVKPCEWQRIELMRTQIPSMGMEPGVRKAGKPRILLHSAPPFHSSLDCPCSWGTSIQGIKLPARGTPLKFFVGICAERRTLATLRSISRIADAGSASSCLTASCKAPICNSSSRIFCAPAPEAA